MIENSNELSVVLLIILISLVIANFQRLTAYSVYCFFMLLAIVFTLVYGIYKILLYPMRFKGRLSPQTRKEIFKKLEE